MELDPLLCVLYMMIRQSSYSRVLCFVSISTEQGLFRLRPAVRGIAGGTITAMVVELVEGELQIVSTYHTGRDLSESSIQTKLSASAKWYGIVGGNIRHEAIFDATKTRESWRYFK